MQRHAASHRRFCLHGTHCCGWWTSQVGLPTPLRDPRQACRSPPLLSKPKACLSMSYVVCTMLTAESFHSVWLHKVALCIIEFACIHARGPCANSCSSIILLLSGQTPAPTSSCLKNVSAPGIGVPDQALSLYPRTATLGCF